MMRPKPLLVFLGLTLALLAPARAPQPQAGLALQGKSIPVALPPPPPPKPGPEPGPAVAPVDPQRPRTTIQRLMAPVALKCALQLPLGGGALAAILMKLAWFADLVLGTVGFWGLLGLVTGASLAAYHLTGARAGGSRRQPDVPTHPVM
ncbi:hypothetical protein [Mesoterricola silvestris]|uniref:Uncharacterized protein n=1 Tax=Mesoterricola silvestris TaxID=2927979 RepID=A0AA48GUL8_9BACT|nr:hypothetical protein [Mesoterricola silvestris]BDU74670.1 hypothetical protein METEAL_38440 [Mesoterricola silvestris]